MKHTNFDGRWVSIGADRDPPGSHIFALQGVSCLPLSMMAPTRTMRVVAEQRTFLLARWEDIHGRTD